MHYITTRRCARGIRRYYVIETLSYHCCS